MGSRSGGSLGPNQAGAAEVRSAAAEPWERVMSLVPAEPGLVARMSEKGHGTLSPRLALTLLCALLVIDFADRQVVVTAFPYLRAEFAVSEVQLGALVSAVSVVVALGAFPVALVVDRWRRARAIAI